MNERNENCQHLLQYLSDYFEGSLDPEFCTELERHISECRNCRVVVDTTRKTIDLYHTYGSETEPLPQEVRHRLFHRLNLEDFLK